MPTHWTQYCIGSDPVVSNFPAIFVKLVCIYYPVGRPAYGLPYLLWVSRKVAGRLEGLASMLM